MSRYLLRNIVSILRESPLYKSLSAEEKRSVIRELTESYSFLRSDNDEEVVGYESSWAEIIRNRR